jgi:peroxiredoxin (alkyl hydroperoxide reductase subunit C)
VSRKNVRCALGRSCAHEQIIQHILLKIIYEGLIELDYEIMMNSYLRLGMKAPDFIAQTTMGEIKLSDYEGKWVVLFSHPGDFTPVCTTEIIAFSRINQMFSDRNTQLIGLSVDSNPSHLEWLNNIYKATGIKVPFPIIADRDASIARKYGMISPEVNNTATVRNVYIIDDKGIIRTILIYPMTNGRNIPEILRILDALQTTDKDKVSTPANWLPGQPVIAPSPQTFDTLLDRVTNPEGLSCMDWYLCFKQ